MSARCFSNSKRLALRLKRGRSPSLASKISNTPLAERDDCVMSSGRWRLGSSPRIQVLRRVDLPLPGAPVRSMTPRRAAVDSNKLSASRWLSAG